MKPWFHDWFNSAEYLTVYKKRNFDDAKKLIDLIKQNVNLPIGSLALDVACGMGRHSILLRNIGYKVFGVDLSKNLLLKAKENNPIQNPVQFIRGDLNNLPFKRKFNLIVNLFTSFGYFETDEENFQLFTEVSRCLLQNGIFVFDYFNKSFLENNLVEKSEEVIDNLIVKNRRKIVNGRIIKDITIIKNEKKVEFQESVKIYSLDKIILELKNSGFTTEKIFGSYSGDNFKEINSERIILICTV